MGRRPSPGATTYTDYLLGGVTDSLYLPFVLLAVWRWDRYRDPDERGTARWAGPLALGAAMAVGSVMAIVRPPEQPKEGDLTRAPMTRSVTMAVVGALAAIWALASLIAN